MRVAVALGVTVRVTVADTVGICVLVERAVVVGLGLADGDWRGDAAGEGETVGAIEGETAGVGVGRTRREQRADRFRNLLASALVRTRGAFQTLTPRRVVMYPTFGTAPMRHTTGCLFQLAPMRGANKLLLSIVSTTRTRTCACAGNAEMRPKKAKMRAAEDRRNRLRQVRAALFADESSCALSLVGMEPHSFSMPPQVDCQN